MDFLRRRVSILVTFSSLLDSQTAYCSLLLATQGLKSNLPGAKLYYTREENVALGRNVFRGENYELGKLLTKDHKSNPLSEHINIFLVYC